MGLGRQWGTGYCREYEYVADALNTAKASDVEALREFVDLLTNGSGTLMDAQAATLMKGQPAGGYDKDRIDANWYGRGGPSMWKRTATQRPSEIEAIVRQGRLELAKKLLEEADRCEIVGQCGHDECEIWITWPSDQAGPDGRTVKMWVFVPDNSAYGEGRYCKDSGLTPGQHQLVDELRAEVRAAGPKHIPLPPSGEPYGTPQSDPLVAKIMNAASRLPAGYPLYRELGLSHPADAGAAPARVEITEGAGQEPDAKQQGADSKYRPDGPKANVMRITTARGAQD